MAVDVAAETSAEYEQRIAAEDDVIARLKLRSEFYEFLDARERYVTAAREVAPLHERY